MKTLAAIAAPLALLLAAGCTAETSSNSVPQVITSIYPLQFVADRVAGGDATVTNLTAPGAEPHDLELTARQVADLSHAELAVYIDGLQPAVDEALAQAKPQRVVDVLAQADTIEAAEDEHEHGDDHADEQGDEPENGHIDPHIWLDPANLKAGATEIAKALGDLDPQHANAYNERAQKLAADLDILDNEFVSGLKSCERRTIVTAHAAFGYLARAYDLEQIPIAGLDPSQEPSTSELARIAREVEHEHVTTIFTERLVSPAVAQAVARETGATTAVLDPIEGLSDATSDDDYLSLMRANLAAIRKANGCS